MSLADVYPSCLASLGMPNQPNSLDLPETRVAVVVLVDGLGAQNLERNRAHARFLSGHLDSGGQLTTIFPSTTSAALATLTTGKFPGSHGMVGYRILNPDAQEIVNQLTGVTDAMIDGGWLRQEPLYRDATSQGVSCTVVSHKRFATTPLTRLIHSGSRQQGAQSYEERVDAVIDIAHSAGRQLILLYISELDERAHKWGIQSHQWCSELEMVDAALADLDSRLPKDAGMLITADHGIVDVAHHEQLMYRSDDAALAKVQAYGGEPRCLQLYVHAGTSSHDVCREVREYFTQLAGDDVVVVRRDEMIASGFLGEVNASISDRLGDIFVLCTTGTALYDACDQQRSGRDMIGQHGGISSQERSIPLIRLGAFS